MLPFSLTEDFNNFQSLMSKFMKEEEELVIEQILQRYEIVLSEEDLESGLIQLKKIYHVSPPKEKSILEKYINALVKKVESSSKGKKKKDAIRKNYKIVTRWGGNYSKDPDVFFQEF
jgi:hypothetical protein